jgi:hypothetical protein
MSLPRYSPYQSPSHDFERERVAWPDRRNSPNIEMLPSVDRGFGLRRDGSVELDKAFKRSNMGHSGDGEMN